MHMNSTGSAKINRTTLRDVAQLAGVSEISVSRVMRNAPNISDALRKKVMTAADTLSYTPNRVAGALRNQSSNLVAVVLPSMSNEVFSAVLDGVETILAQHGLNAVLGLSNYDRERELQVVRELLSWSPSGIILTGLHHDATIESMIRQQGIPVVQIMDIEGTPLDSAVGISHTKAAEAAADHLYERGFRNIGYIGAWRERPDRSRARRLSFAARLNELCMSLDASKIVEERSSALVGATATAELLSDHPNIDAIFYANDDLALGGLFHAMSEGLRIPEDIGFLGFNGIGVGKATPTPLSSIETPRYEMGVRAAELLLNSQSDERSEKFVVDLDFKVFQGGTT